MALGLNQLIFLTLFPEQPGSVLRVTSANVSLAFDNSGSFTDTSTTSFNGTTLGSPAPSQIQVDEDTEFYTAAEARVTEIPTGADGQPLGLGAIVRYSASDDTLANQLSSNAFVVRGYANTLEAPDKVAVILQASDASAYCWALNDQLTVTRLAP